jgi:hypothetical protein
MVAAVLATMVFFAVVSLWKFSALEARISQPRQDPPAIVWVQPGATSTFDERLQVSTLQARYSLERETIERRYAQAALAFEARLWTRFMGFLTGMILAVVGATFVLGKLETDATDLGANAGRVVAMTLRSTSPGLVLAVLGTVLMTVSIAIPATADTEDAAIYFVREAPRAPKPPIPSYSAANPAAEEDPPLRP